MPRPICVPCRIEMRPEKNGQPVRWGETVYFGDLWRCPGCQHEAVIGFGSSGKPAEHCTPETHLDAIYAFDWREARDAGVVDGQP